MVFVIMLWDSKCSLYSFLQNTFFKFIKIIKHIIKILRIFNEKRLSLVPLLRGEYFNHVSDFSYSLEIFSYLSK